MVLFVDDDEDTREAIADLLGGYSIPVRCVATNEEALRLLRTEHPRIVFVDLHREGGTTYELFKAIRGLPHMRDVPLVLVTGDHEALLPPSGNVILKKPFDAGALLALIETPPVRRQ